MTEPEVASSDATNIATRIERQGDDYVINGHKWWISGAATRAARSSSPWARPTRRRRATRSSMIVVPADTPGIRIVRPLNVFGYDDAPHGHVEMYFENVRCRRATSCSAKAAASRSPRAASARAASTTACALIGLAERALELMCRRSLSRTAFGKTVAQQGVWQERIAERAARSTWRAC
jgi:acyl-CoA dehydrogenase